MTVYKNTDIKLNDDLYTTEDLMRLRRDRIRERRMRKGSLICGQILSINSADNLVNLEPVELNAAI